MGWEENRAAAFAEGQAKFLETLDPNFNSDDCPYDERSSWINGFYKAKDNFVKDKIKDFLAELHQICDKHGITVSSGCGCCGGGIITINGKEYEFSF